MKKRPGKYDWVWPLVITLELVAYAFMSWTLAE